MTGSLVSINPETRFNRNARLLLLFALVFILLDIAQLVYRLTLPTEGWEIHSDENDPGVYDFYMLENLVGAPSPLQPGDALHIIGGIPAAKIFNPDNDSLVIPPPSGWQTGGHILVTVIRDGQPLTFEIPIVNWTLAAWLRSNFTNLNGMMGWIIVLSMLGVGLLTLFKRPGNLAARFLFLFWLAVFATRLGGSLPDGLGFYFNFLAGYGKVLFANVIFAYLFGPALLGFGLTFPRPKAFIQRRPWLLVAPFLIGSIPVVLLFIQPELATTGFPITLGMILATIAALIHSALTMRDAISRAQLRWAVGGVVLGLALFTTNYWVFYDTSRIEQVTRIIGGLGLPVMGIALAVAILRYRLFDIDRIIRRTLVYTILTALLGAVYFGSVVVLQSLLTGSRGLLAGGEAAGRNQPSSFVIVVTTLLIAALFNPLRKQVQDFIDRRFYRRKYNAEKTLAKFAATTRSQADLGMLVAELTMVVHETLEPESVQIWLKPNKKP